jgi:hypothetical protein
MITSSNYANDQVFSLEADTSCNRGRNPVESPSDQILDRESLPDSVFDADHDYHTPAPSKDVLRKIRGLHHQAPFLASSFEKLSFCNERI